MNTLKITAIAMVVVMAGIGLAEARGQGCRGKGQRQGSGRNSESCQTNFASLPLEDLSADEKASLLLLRQEEKLARDVYLTLGETYSLKVFSNIPRAEQRHLDRMGELLERYNLDDPVKDNEPGVFSDDTMQTLYNDLVEQGLKSEIEALKVGATIEDLDIHDLNLALEGGVDNQDIIMVYQNLVKGSRNHMRAFTARMDDHGVEYKAQYISQNELQDIVNSEWERGPADGQNGNGRGQGRGKGRGHGQGRGCCNN